MTETPQDIEARFAAGLRAHSEGRPAEAVEIYRSLLNLRPTANLLVNLGAALADLGRHDDAIRVLNHVIASKPSEATAHYNLGNAFTSRMDWPRAEAAYREALRLQPDFPLAKLNLGRVLLGLGHYAEGWPLLEARADIPGVGAVRPATTAPEWKGEPLEGRSILIWAEQGNGDQIQFARFAPVLRAMGARVSLACLPLLTPLLGQLADQVFTAEGVVVVPRHDFWTFPQSIPARLGTTLDTIPPAPYLTAPPSYRTKWAGHVPAGFNVGIVWRGNPLNSIDHRRSLPSRDLLDPLGDLGVNLIDLQAPLDDFADLAAIIEQLDLLISVDTAPAHLAGALGTPCWIMYPHEGTDWRWLWDRSDSPWYPSVRLYRQPAPGDWASVIAAVARDLAKLTPKPQ